MPHDPFAALAALGVDPEVLATALRFLRDAYPLATKANVYLELAGAGSDEPGLSGISVAITNQRDATTHLVSLLRAPGASRDDQLDQVANMREHLRRAILESYERAVTHVLLRLLNKLAAYKSEVLGSPHLKELNPIPLTLAEIESTLRGIRDLQRHARMTKLRNKWDPEWEEGAAQLIQACDTARDLELRVETAIVHARQVRASWQSSRLTWLVGIGGMIGGVVIAWLINAYFKPS